MTEFCIFLPFPPSTNNLFATVGKRRVKSAKYKKWIASSVELTRDRMRSWSTPVLEGPILTGPARVLIIVKRPDNRRRDLDNLLKAPLDLLVSMGLIGDDSDIVSLAIRWGPVTEMDNEPHPSDCKVIVSPAFG